MEVSAADSLNSPQVSPLGEGLTSAGLAVSIPCPKCGAPFSSDLFTAAPQVACSSCGTFVTAFLFPALYRKTISVQAPETLLTDSEASCFFHPSKKAVVACSSCGRFLCGLCDLDWEGQHLCTACLDTGKKKGKMKNLENKRTLYDHIALFVAAASLIPLFWFFTFITAPLGLYLSIRYWNAPGSLLSRSKARFVLAILICTVILLGWVWIIMEMVHKVMK